MILIVPLARIYAESHSCSSPVIVKATHECCFSSSVNLRASAIDPEIFSICLRGYVVKELVF